MPEQRSSGIIGKDTTPEIPSIADDFINSKSPKELKDSLNKFSKFSSDDIYSSIATLDHEKISKFCKKLSENNMDLDGLLDKITGLDPEKISKICKNLLDMGCNKALDKLFDKISELNPEKSSNIIVELLKRAGEDKNMSKEKHDLLFEKICGMLEKQIEKFGKDSLLSNLIKAIKKAVDLATNKEDLNKILEPFAKLMDYAKKKGLIQGKDADVDIKKGKLREFSLKGSKEPTTGLSKKKLRRKLKLKPLDKDSKKKKFKSNGKDIGKKLKLNKKTKEKAIEKIKEKEIKKTKNIKRKIKGVKKVPQKSFTDKNKESLKIINHAAAIRRLQSIASNKPAVKNILSKSIGALVYGTVMSVQAKTRQVSKAPSPVSKILPASKIKQSSPSPFDPAAMFNKKRTGQ